jgi:predicted transglutaminase-like cysteine proteinase
MLDLAIEAGSGQMKSLISITLIALSGLLLSACESISASEPLVDGVAAAPPRRMGQLLQPSCGGFRMPMIVLDHAHWTQLEQVQLKVDGKVAYQTDQQHFGAAELWEPAGKTGDCEDMALAKRQRLVALGWPADDLRIAVAIDEKGELHAVLTVDVVSTKGAPATYVLDSRFLHVEPWKRLSEFGYTWVERAKPGSAQWSRLGDGAAETRAIASLQASIPIAAAGGPSPVGVESQ